MKIVKAEVVIDDSGNVRSVQIDAPRSMPRRFVRKAAQAFVEVAEKWRGNQGGADD